MAKPGPSDAVLAEIAKIPPAEIEKRETLTPWEPLTPPVDPDSKNNKGSVVKDIQPPAKADKEPTKLRPEDQPLPVVNDLPIVQDEVVQFIQKRKDLGVQRYGTALQPHNGRDGLRDLLEELVDAVNYTAQLIIERDGHL